MVHPERGMFRYRPDQGVYARGTSFWVLVLFAWLAGTRFRYWAESWGAWATRRLLDGPVPVVGVHLTPAFLLGTAVFLGFAYVAWRAVNHPRLGDLLIGTEAEMKKVTWPSFEDCRKSSLVVIGSVIFMLAFLGVTDLVLGWVFRSMVAR